MDKYLPTFNDDEIKETLKSVSIGRRRVFNNQFSFELGYLLQQRGKTLEGLSIKRVNIPSIFIKDLYLLRVSFAGSMFEGPSFESCKMNNVHAQHCRFHKVSFKDERALKIQNSDFSYSFFDNCYFENIMFVGDSFLECIFWDCSFKNCIFRASSFESASFSNCVFESTTMQYLNCEFSTMKNCKISNSIFSWYQVPYINGFFYNSFSGVNYINAIKKRYTLEKYKDDLQKSTIFFSSQNQYYPLISLYLLSENSDYAKAALWNGIDDSIMKKDLRTLGLFVYAGIFYNLMSRKEISQLINRMDHLINLDTEQDEYTKVLYSKIKSKLVYPDIIPHIEISIQTNLEENELEKVGDLCNEIDSIVEQNGGKAIYRISHNSDPILTVYIIQTAIMGATLIYTLVKDFLEKKKHPAENDHNQQIVVNNYNIVITNSILNDNVVTNKTD